MIPIIYRSLDQLCAHIKKASQSRQVIKIDAGFASLTSDIIYGYLLGYPSDNLGKADFNEHVRDGINGILRQSHLILFFPIIPTIVGLLPLRILKSVNPFMHAFVEEKSRVHDQVVKTLSGHRTNEGSVLEKVFDKGLPEHLRGSRRLANEAISILNAGTETTARALVVGLYNLIENSSIRAKLREELQSVMPMPESRPTWDQLKQLPYLVY
jgi:cytochrome P450